MLFKKIKRIITGKKDQNIKSDALLEEEKNELIIERFVENHNDVINWSKEDQERLEKLVHPECKTSKKIRDLVAFSHSYLSAYFNFDETDKKNYTIQSLQQLGKSLGLKKLIDTILVSIKREDSEDEVKLLNKAREDPLLKFNGSTKPGTKVVIKYKTKKSKTINELSIKTGSFNDNCSNNHFDWSKEFGLSNEQANVCIKEWKREYFYLGFLANSRMQEIKDKNLKYEKKTLIDKFLSLKEDDNIDNWPDHLLDRLKPILTSEVNTLEKFRKFSIFRGSYLSFFYEPPKKHKTAFIPTKSSLVVSYVGQEPEDGDGILKAGCTLVAISELKPVRIGKNMSDKAVNTVKLKTQNDLLKFLYGYKPETKIEIKFFDPSIKKIQTSTYKTRSFQEHVMDGLRNTYFNFTFNNAKADLIAKEFKQSYIQGFPTLALKRIEEIQNMDIWNEEDKEKIINKFSTDYLREAVKKWNKEDIKLLKKLLKPRFNELNFETSTLNLFFNPQLVKYFKKFDIKIKKGISSCITYMLNWHVPGADLENAGESVNVKNFEKLVSATDNTTKKILIYDEASDSEKISFFKNTSSLTIKYTSNQNGKLKTEKTDLSVSEYGFENVCERFSNWLRRIYNNYKVFNQAKINLAMKEWRKSFFEGYPDFTLERLKEIKKMDLEDEPEEEDYTDDDYSEGEGYDEKKIYITTTVKKEKVAGKESFVLTLDGLPDDEKLETLRDGKKIFLKIYIFDVTDLESNKYYEILDTTGLTDQYFSNHCHVIKTNEVTWSDENMNLIQSKELELYGDRPTELAFPYSVMQLPKVGKRKLSFRTFLCTNKQKFDDVEGRPKDGESINYRPESFKMDDDGEYGFDDHGDYSEILSYASSEIEVEYKQPGYLDINKRKYNDLKIALGSALNQLGGGSLKEKNRS